MNIEEYIKDNKEALHTESPSAAVWQHIENHYAPAKSSRWYWIAAASLLLAATGSVFLLLRHSGTNKQQSQQPGTPYALLPVSKIPDTQTTSIPVAKTSKPEIVPNKPALQHEKNKNGNPAPLLAKSIKKEKNVFYTGQNFYDSLLRTLKQRIEATPVKWVEEDYFKIYTNEYKNLEQQEKDLRNQVVAEENKSAYILRLIQINQRKLVVLDNLLQQINNVNNKKGDTARIQNKKIII